MVWSKLNLKLISDASKFHFMRPRNIREALEGKITPEELKFVRAFDIVGDIAILKLPEQLLPKKQLIGQALLDIHRSLKTVLLQTGPVSGEFRTRELEVIAGEAKTETIHKESGCIFKTDLSQVYFSPRLAHERLRIACLVKPGEVVANLFAGVGCYSIVIAKHSQAALIYSIDINPAAFHYAKENIRLNKVGDKVIPLLGDAREIVKQRLRGVTDRVLMPLPEKARDFLDVAFLALKPEGGIIHFYDIGQEPNVFGPSFEFVRNAAAKKNFSLKLLHSRKIRSYAPRCYHVVLDIAVIRDPSIF